MSRLIINADDLGINPQRSHGIFQCIEFGVVTSASLLPNGTDSDEAGKRGRERGVSLGLHLNLTDEYPLSSAADISSLVDGNDHFFNSERLLQLFIEGSIQREHLEREIRAQVEWMFDIYGSPTHISSHDHIHLHPLVIDALVPVMERYGLSSIRIPSEEPLPPFGYDVSEAQLASVQSLNARALAARKIYESHGIRSTDHFRGSTLHTNASIKNMRHILSRLPEGTTELMVHPGSQSAFGTPFDLDPQRQTELRMLLDETIPAMLREKKIECISWADL